MSLLAVILAAGQGKRMNSDMPKVIHEICGRPLVEWVAEAADGAGVQDKIVVVGSGWEAVRAKFNDKFKYVMREEQLGTGHAVGMAKAYIGKFDDVLILAGDAPLITSNTLKTAYSQHEDATILTTLVDDPTGYGRIIKNDGAFERIVEEKDANPVEGAVKEVNSGMYFFKSALLLEYLDKIGNDNAQGEYYLTDVIELLIKAGRKVGTFEVDFEETLGINDRIQLYEAQKIMQDRINRIHMKNGVTFIDKNTAYISCEVIIGRDTVIYPNTTIEGKTVIGNGSVVFGSRIVSSKIGDDTQVQNSVVLHSEVGNHTEIGPFAYVRPGSKIGDHIKIGDFVEIKNSVIGDKTKVSHLSYIGDADVGSGVNIGCGTVVVNYDGAHKHRSTIKDNVFVGCNANLVSPVVLEENSFVAAGSTITRDVPKDTLAIARTRQEIKEKWRRPQKNG